MFETSEIICISDSLDLLFTGDFTDNSILSWVNPNGIVIGDSVNYRTGFSEPGEYTIEVTVEEDGCISEVFSLEVEVEAELTLPDPGIQCESTTESIEFSWPDLDCASSYTIFINGSELGTLNGTSFELDNLAPGTQIQLDLMANSDCVCGDQIFSTTCVVEACTDFQLDFNEVSAACLADASPMQLDFSVVGNPDLSDLTWSGSGVDNDGVFDPAAAGPGDHMVTVSFGIGNCFYTDSGIITIFDSPTAEISAMDPSCSGITDGSLEILPSGGDQNYTITVNNEVVTNTLLDSIQGDTYVINIVDGNLCAYNETIVLNQPSDQDLAIIGNTVVIAGDSNLYSVNTTIPVDEIISITWFNDLGEVLCDSLDCIDFEFAPENDMNICVLVEYGDGCIAEDCIEIRAEEIRRIYLPNTFSPNDDGVNDLWQIFPNNEVASMPLLQIYNRWGERIFEERDLSLDGSSPSWDGQFKGRRLNPGVYVYSCLLYTSPSPRD